MFHDYIYEYENVHLRPLVEDDIELLRVWRNNPDNTTYLNKIPYITPENQAEWYKNYLKNDDEVCFSILENQELKRLVGSLSLYHFETESCSFGKILIGDKEAHGRKVGLNATIAATKVAFDILNLKRINLCVYLDNFVAVKIYQKAGFVVTKTYKASNGKDEYIMTMIRGESYNA